jgi:hypothetical protein
MKVYCQVGPKEVRQALAVAEALGVPELTRQLNAPLDAALMGRVDEAWEYIKEGVLNGMRRGREETRAVVEEVWTKVSGILAAAGNKVRLLEEGLFERVRAYNAGLQKSLLQQVPGEIAIGGLVLTLGSLEMTQSVRVEGSLKTTLADMIQVTSDGSLEVAASYQRTTSAAK